MREKSLSCPHQVKTCENGSHAHFAVFLGGVRESLRQKTSKTLFHHQCWASYSETAIRCLLLITPYTSDTFTDYFLSKVISCITCYFTLLLLQPK